MNDHIERIDTTSQEQPTEVEGEPPEPGITVQVANEQSTLTVNEQLLIEAVQVAFANSPYTSGYVSIAVVDDPTIHQLNRQFLEHDYPTDVLSFSLEDRPPHLEGELIVSADTAISNAATFGWSAHDELVLYVLHGTLHLAGYRDKQPQECQAMYAAEAKCLQSLGIQLPTKTDRWSDVGEADEVTPS